MVIEGRVADINRAFAVELEQYRGDDAVFRSHRGVPQIPSWLANSVEGVTGLSTAPFARPHFVVGPKGLRPLPGAPAPTPAAPQDGFTPPAIAQAYGVPKTATAKDQTIAIIELGGGYHRQDFEQACKTLGIPVPQLTDVSVDGAKNSPGRSANPATADGEVALDRDFNQLGCPRG